MNAIERRTAKLIALLVVALDAHDGDVDAAEASVKSSHKFGPGVWQRARRELGIFATEEI